MRVCGALLILSLSLCGDATEVLLKLSRDDQITQNTEHHEHQVTLNFNGKTVSVKDNGDSQLLKDNLANLTEHYGDLESRYNELQTKFDQLQSRYNETTEHKDQLQSSLDQLQSRYNETTEHKDQLQSSLDQLQSKSTTMQSGLDQLQSRCNKTTEQLQSSLEQQKISHNKLKEERDRLQSSYQQLDSRCNPVTVNPRILCESDGFTLDGAVCYYLSNSTAKKSWAESKQYCKDKQADLIFINNHDKQDLVDRVSPRFQGFWIGLTDRDTEGSFKWVNGKPLTSPTFWAPGQPGRDRKGDFDCVYYYNGEVSYRGWFDTYCYLPLSWMCERFVQ